MFDQASMSLSALYFSPLLLEDPTMLVGVRMRKVASSLQILSILRRGASNIAETEGLIEG